VETEEQAKILRLLKCDEMQGYLFSKPLPIAALVELLRRALEQDLGACRRRQCAQSVGIADRLAHLLQRLGLDLADALGRDVELGGEVVQRRAVSLLQPARLDDAAAARVEAGERLLQAGGLHARRLFGLQHAVRLGFVVGEVCAGA